MEDIIKIVLEYVAIWAPSLVAILGIVASILTAYNKTAEAIEAFKADKSLKDVNDNITRLANDNAELVRCNKLLLEEITKIKDYAGKGDKI